MGNSKLSRREFLRLSTLAASGLTLAACAPQATTTSAPAAATVPAAATAPQATEVPTTAPATAEKGKMVFWPEWGGKDADALQVQVKKWTEQTGIECDFLPIRDHARMIAAMSAGAPPDLLMTWDAGAVGSWGFAGALQDLKPMIEAAKFDMSTLHPLGVASGNLMGIKQIGLPLSNYLTGIFYWNKDVFKKAGLDPEKGPETWEDVADFDKKTAVLNGKQLEKIGFMILTGGDNDPTTMAYAYGGSIWSDDFRTVTPDSEANIEALTWMQKMYALYTTDEIRRWVSSNPGDVSKPTDPIFTGNGAMRIDGEWVPSYVDKLPDLKINLGATYLPHPANKPDVKRVMCANSNPMVIPTQATNPDAAFSFIKFISIPANSAEVCNLVGNASPVNEGVKLQAPMTTNAMYKWVLEEAWVKGNIKPATINSPIGAQFKDAYTAARAEVLEDGKDPVTTMKALRDKIQPDLDAALKKLGL